MPIIMRITTARTISPIVSPPQPPRPGFLLYLSLISEGECGICPVFGGVSNFTTCKQFCRYHHPKTKREAQSIITTMNTISASQRHPFPLCREPGPLPPLPNLALKLSASSGTSPGLGIWCIAFPIFLTTRNHIASPPDCQSNPLTDRSGESAI